MPMSQKAFTLKAERAKARRSFWCMNRGKTEGPASACQWDEEQKKKSVIKKHLKTSIPPPEQTTPRFDPEKARRLTVG